MTIRATTSAVAAALVLGLVAGATGVWWVASGRIDAANLRAERAGDLVREQNRAIEALRADAERRAIAAAEAIKKAGAARRVAEIQAQELLARPQPAGVAPCEAASALIREELRR